MIHLIDILFRSDYKQGVFPDRGVIARRFVFICAWGHVISDFFGFWEVIHDPH